MELVACCDKNFVAGVRWSLVTSEGVLSVHR
jgi:hypothetical protein